MKRLWTKEWLQQRDELKKKIPVAKIQIYKLRANSKNKNKKEQKNLKRH